MKNIFTARDFRKISWIEKINHSKIEIFNLDITKDELDDIASKIENIDYLINNASE